MMPKLYVKTLSWEWSGPYWGAPCRDFYVSVMRAWGQRQTAFHTLVGQSKVILFKNPTTHWAKFREMEIHFASSTIR